MANREGVGAAGGGISAAAKPLGGGGGTVGGGGPVTKTSGGGGGGGGATYDPAAAPAATSSPTNYEEAVRAKYGYMVAYLNHPELGPLLRQAVDENWDPARLQAALQATGWWQHTSESMRQWEALERLDPASATRRRDSTRLDIENMLQQWGYWLDSTLTGEIARASLMYGWSEAELRRFLIMEAEKHGPAKMTGTIQAMTATIKASALNDWMIQIDDQTAYEFAKKIALGELTLDGLKAYFQQQAKSKFGHLGEWIDQGITPGQFFAPYKQLIASELELTPEQIDFLNDTRWSQVVSHHDGKTIRPMTLSETMEWARRQEDYKGTGGAQEKAANLAETLMRTFGKVA